MNPDRAMKVLNWHPAPLAILIKWNLAKLRGVNISHPTDRAKSRSHVLQKFFIIL
jgi:hypothetical protein